MATQRQLMWRTSPQICPRSAPLNAHTRQMSETRFVTRMIVQFLNFRVRSGERDRASSGFNTTSYL